MAFQPRERSRWETRSCSTNDPDAFTAAAVAVLGCIVIEVIHIHRYGHPAPFGLHGDVTVTKTDDLLGVKGTANIYRAHFTNYGPFPISLTVCDYLNYVGLKSCLSPD